MENQIFSLIPSTYLLAIGIILIALEMLTFTFFLFWFGVSFLLVAGLTLLNIFPTGLWQLSSIAIIAMIMLFFLRTKSLELFLKSKEKHNDNFLNEAGTGTIQHKKVNYKATYWKIGYEGDETFEEDEKVTVLRTEKGVAFIQKK